jgi:hypothetical protein
MQNDYFQSFDDFFISIVSLINIQEWNRFSSMLFTRLFLINKEMTSILLLLGITRPCPIVEVVELGEKVS